MVDRDDVFSAFEAVLIDQGQTNPWITVPGADPAYQPDYGLLELLLRIPIAQGSGSESGRLAKAIDAWVAYELRRSGFPPDEVWPRLTKPRVLPREVGLFVDGLPKRLQGEVRQQLLKNKAVAPSDARVLGRAYVKQVDVLVAQWARGPEVLVSTKSMVSSFRNNLANRFEESYGDAKNLRGRYPMASMGFLFVLRSTVLDELGTFEKVLDMLRKLRAETNVYDATSVVVAEWSDREFDGVTLRRDVVPEDLGVANFMETLIRGTLDRTPIEMHVEVRERREHRVIPLEESDSGETLPKAPGNDADEPA
jgi:hypothetical protein